jgi:hypothetical protein
MVGDALIFPLYLAAGTWKTNLRVVNTSKTHAVVAKVVFREGVYSCEVRDFFIFMTPNDVWTADVVDVNGVTRIQSTDESGPENPMDIGMGLPCCNGAVNLGYVEVYEVCSFYITKPGMAGPVVPLDKSVLKACYDAVGPLDIPGCGDECTAITVQGVTIGVVDPYSVLVCQAKNVLTGREEIGSTVDNITLALNAEALANNCNTDRLTVFEETRWDNYGNNSEYEIRAALAKQEIFMPFNVAMGNTTIGIFNFPAKLSCCLGGSQYCDGDLDDDDLCCGPVRTDYAAKTYDMEEHSITGSTIYSPPPPEEQYYWTKEVTFIDASALTGAYSQGWIRFYNLSEPSLDHGVAKADGLWTEYNGSAVIPTALECKDGDLYWIRLPYECGMVNVSDASTDGDASAGSIEGNGVHFDNCSYQDTSLSLWWLP